MYGGRRWMQGRGGGHPAEEASPLEQPAQNRGRGDE